ncbi:myelin-oligodendrocyte glycoprotein-like [Centroberyx gerrardi]
MKLLLVFVLLHVSQHALGEQTVLADGGRDVLLPFQFSGAVDKDSIVEWSRDDLNPKIVHVLRDGADVPGAQNPRYSGRTALRSDALTSGDLSLTLSPAQPCDSGTYTCTVRKNGAIQDQTMLKLEVRVPDAGLTAGEIAGIVVGVLLAFISGFIIGFILRPRLSNK